MSTMIPVVRTLIGPALGLVLSAAFALSAMTPGISHSCDQDRAAAAAEVPHGHAGHAGAPGAPEDPVPPECQCLGHFCCVAPPAALVMGQVTAGGLEAFRHLSGHAGWAPTPARAAHLLPFAQGPPAYRPA